MRAAVCLAQKVLVLINQLRVAVGTGEWLGSLSLGAAERIDFMSRPDDLIARADNGLYAAKRAGRNRVAVAE